LFLKSSVTHHSLNLLPDDQEESAIPDQDFLETVHVGLMIRGEILVHML